MTAVRQPAYDAVYTVIRTYPTRSDDEYGRAVENGRVWRAVEAALDAMGVPADRPGLTCPRCGSTDPLGPYDVCGPCAAAMGWDPRCQACDEEGRGQTATVPHVDTCAGKAEGTS